MVNWGPEGSGETRLETIISYILIIGVAVSFTVLAIGLFIFYRAHGSWAIVRNPSVFIASKNFFSFLINDVRGSASMPAAVRIMSLGVALLILTPYVRAVLSAIYFAAERNFTYFVITVFVLAVLTWSLAVH
jgi:uncharacterized membrane protein